MATMCAWPESPTTAANGDARASWATRCRAAPSSVLNVRWRNSSQRRDWGSNTRFDENRLIVSYPLSLL